MRITKKKLKASLCRSVSSGLPLDGIVWNFGRKITLSAGAMLIFSVLFLTESGLFSSNVGVFSYQIDQMPEGEGFRLI